MLDEDNSKYPKFVHITSSGFGRALKLKKPLYIIGSTRNPRVNIGINGDSIEDRHAIIQILDSGMVYLNNISKKDNVSVNFNQLLPSNVRELFHMDLVSIGSHNFYFLRPSKTNCAENSNLIPVEIPNKIVRFAEKHKDDVLVLQSKNFEESPIENKLAINNSTSVEDKAVVVSHDKNLNDIKRVDKRKTSKTKTLVTKTIVNKSKECSLTNKESDTTCNTNLISFNLSEHSPNLHFESEELIKLSDFHLTPVDQQITRQFVVAYLIRFCLKEKIKKNFIENVKAKAKDENFSKIFASKLKIELSKNRISDLFNNFDLDIVILLHNNSFLKNLKKISI